MKFLPIIATIAGIFIANSATAQLIQSTPAIANPSIPKVRVVGNGTKLRIYNGTIIKTIQATSLKVRVLDSLNCEGKLVTRRTLSGKKFSPKAITIDNKTGNLAVGVLLQNCSKQNISAAFILQPKPNWNYYVIHRVAVPGKREINNRFSTYPLRNIKGLGFIDGNLIIKYTDIASSEALLVYSTSNKPAGKYAGCVVTQLGKSDNICPSFN
ncbi:MAG: hypothetical protein AAF630_17000 [Cyanobacteria bacterium P01_C01_bin.38]